MERGHVLGQRRGEGACPWTPRLSKDAFLEMEVEQGCVHGDRDVRGVDESRYIKTEFSGMKSCRAHSCFICSRISTLALRYRENICLSRQTREHSSMFFF